MCDPVSLTIAAAVVTGAGQVASGIGQAQQMRYAAGIADRNAALDRRSAQDALERGAIEERKQYRRNAQLQGAQRAAMAANGIETEFGSALDLQTDSKRIGWEDARTLRENAIRESKGFEISASNQTAEAAAKRAGARSAIIGTIFDVGGTILSSAKQVGKVNANRSAGGSGW